jgi:hypothetical protein
LKQDWREKIEIPGMKVTSLSFLQGEVFLCFPMEIPVEFIARIFNPRLFQTGNNSKPPETLTNPKNLFTTFHPFFSPDLFFLEHIQVENTLQPIFHACENNSKSSINFPNIKSNYKPNFPFNKISSEVLEQSKQRKG